MWEGVRYQFYASKDGYILFMASEQSFWKNFCHGIGRVDLFDAFPGSTYADHARGNTALQIELRDIFATKTTAEWLIFADEHNTTIAPVNTPQTVMDDAQFQDRFTWASTEQLGCEQLLLPLHVTGEEIPMPERAPENGQHTDEVLKDILHLDDAAITSLRAAGALG